MRGIHCKVVVNRVDALVVLATSVARSLLAAESTKPFN